MYVLEERLKGWGSRRSSSQQHPLI